MQKPGRWEIWDREKCAECVATEASSIIDAIHIHSFLDKSAVTKL
jgi:hypothetical protein